MHVLINLEGIKGTEESLTTKTMAQKAARGFFNLFVATTSFSPAAAAPSLRSTTATGGSELAAVVGMTGDMCWPSVSLTPIVARAGRSSDRGRAETGVFMEGRDDGTGRSA